MNKIRFIVYLHISLQLCEGTQTLSNNGWWKELVLPTLLCRSGRRKPWEEFLCPLYDSGWRKWPQKLTNNFCPRYLLTPRVCPKYRPPKTELTGKARQGKARHIASCMFSFRCCSYFHLCSLWPHISPSVAHVRILQPRCVFPIALGITRSRAGGTVGYQILVLP